MNATTTEARINELTTERFSLGLHNGRVTIHNPATGNHRTFKVSTVKGEEGVGLAGKRIVALLTGPDYDGAGRGDWTGFGFVGDDGRIKVWNRMRGSEVPSDFERFARMLEAPARYEDRGCRYMIEATCRRCNRALTHPESIDTGTGPECGGRGRAKRRDRDEVEMDRAFAQAERDEHERAYAEKLARDLEQEAAERRHVNC